MNKKLEEYIEREGWIVECESPLELRHNESGSFASGVAADIVLDDLDYDMCFEHNQKLQENIEPKKTRLKRYEDFEEGDFSQNTKYRIIVPTKKDKEELMEAFETIHYSDIDTDIIVLNQLAHEYQDRNSIVVDKNLYNSLPKI